MYLMEMNFKDMESLRIDYVNILSQYREGDARRRAASRNVKPPRAHCSSDLDPEKQSSCWSRIIERYWFDFGLNYETSVLYSTFFTYGYYDNLCSYILLIPSIYRSCSASLMR